MSRHIAPCPYCGNEKPGHDVRYIGNICTGGRIVCRECGVTGPYGNSLGEAAERWNAMPREEREDG